MIVLCTITAKILMSIFGLLLCGYRHLADAYTKLRHYQESDVTKAQEGGADVTQAVSTSKVRALASIRH